MFPLEFLHTKEHFRAGRNNVPLEYAFAVPHKKKLKFQMRKNCSEAQTAHLCIIGVGGFLGAGEKSIKRSKKDNKTYTMLDTTKEALERAPGFKYDSTKTGSVPDKSNK